MEITVKVNVQEILNEMFEDFNPHEDSFELDLKETIKDGIVGDVKRQIIQMHNKDIRDKIISESKSLIDLEISEMIKKGVNDFAENGKLEIPYQKDMDPMSVQEWINYHFAKKSSEYTSTLKREIDKRSEVAVKQLKERYDLLFASQVITKMQDQGMLKDGVFKALMKGD